MAWPKPSCEWTWSTGPREKELCIKNRHNKLLKSFASKYSLWQYPQMQVKIVPSKEKNIYKQDPEMLAPSLGPSSFMMEWGKVENGPVVWPIKIRFFVFFLNHGHSTMQGKDEREWLLYWIVQKQTSVMVFWHIFQQRLCLFQEHDAKPDSARTTTAWLHCKRLQVLSLHACNPDFSLTENKMSNIT